MIDHSGPLAVVATMHGKTRVIAPALSPVLGVEPVAVPDIDTDVFGTFSREIPRQGTALEAARAKVAAAFARAPSARFAIASEGSFGPHPSAPWQAWAREWVLLVDREVGQEFIGTDFGTATNYEHAVVTSPEEAQSFAARIGFPTHGVILCVCRGMEPVPRAGILKDLRNGRALAAGVRSLLDKDDKVHIETDMRADRNPLRMAAIARAAEALAALYATRCPACAARGFGPEEAVPGLPCRRCALPTQVTRARRRACAVCRHVEEIPALGPLYADPGRCDFCNP
jgi:hypothetical protein